MHACVRDDPALLPSGGISVSRAAEENHSRGCLEKMGHMLRAVSSQFVFLFFPSPPSSHHTWSSGSTCRWLCTLSVSLSLFVCLGTSIHASVHTFILPQCLLMLLPLLPDIFRDELLQQGKNRGRAVWATCVPLPSSSLSSGPLPLSLFFF